MKRIDWPCFCAWFVLPIAGWAALASIPMLVRAIVFALRPELR